MRKRVPAVAAAALVALACAGCAGLDSDDAPDNVQTPSLVPKEALDRYPQGSPADTVIEWWRALQFDNAIVAARYYSKSLGITPEDLDRQLQYGTLQLGLTRKADLIDVQLSGAEATVDLLLESVAENPNGRTDRARTARGFNLVREDGRWKLAENSYLERNVRVQRDFARDVARRQAERDR